MAHKPHRKVLAPSRLTGFVLAVDVATVLVALGSSVATVAAGAALVAAPEASVAAVAALVAPGAFVAAPDLQLTPDGAAYSVA